MDWDFFGLMMVIVGMIKEVFWKEEFGVKVVGGKGKKSRVILEELKRIVFFYDFDLELYVRIFCLVVKVDIVVF